MPIRPLHKSRNDATCSHDRGPSKGQISKNVHTFAHEPSLPNVIRQKYFKEKETIRRENLARLLKHGRQQNDLDYSGLAK